MNYGVWFAITSLCPVVAQTYRPLTGAERANWFFQTTYNPPSLLLSSPAVAGWRTYRDKPPEWGKSFDGYAKRYGAHLLNTTISNGAEAVAGAILHEDPRYFPLATGATGQRFRQVFKQTVLSRHSNGEYRFGTARVIGYTTSAVVRQAYLPHSVNLGSHAATRIGIGYAGRLFANFFREFRPEIRAVFKRN